MLSLKPFVLIVCCLAVASAQGSNFTSLAGAVNAANATGSNLSVLMAAVQAAGVDQALGPNTTWTILAPTNEAFGRLEEATGLSPEQLLLPENNETLLNVLSYHVIPSGAVLSSQLTNGQEVPTALAEAAPLTVRLANGTVTFIGGSSNANVEVANIRAGDSVIHVIDNVLIPESDEDASPANATTAAANFTTLGEAVAAANGTGSNLSTLMAAVQAAGLASALGPNTTWTILAPTNEAFAGLEDAIGMTTDDLLLPENNDTLVRVLSYHVIPSGAVLSSQLQDGQEVSTALAGADPITVSVGDNGVTFLAAASNATVQAADVQAGRSVIHVIDNVLLPESENETVAGAANDQSGSLPAVRGAEGLGASSGASSITTGFAASLALAVAGLLLLL